MKKMYIFDNVRTSVKRLLSLLYILYGLFSRCEINKAGYWRACLYLVWVIFQVRDQQGWILAGLFMYKWVIDQT